MDCCSTHGHVKLVAYVAHIVNSHLLPSQLIHQSIIFHTNRLDPDPIIVSIVLRISHVLAIYSQLLVCNIPVL